MTAQGFFAPYAKGGRNPYVANLSCARWQDEIDIGSGHAYCRKM
ncbi:hypothetical protein ADIS_4735 [Lunatimonas lonarensis]|uniref:Uncharacterized protein n=1 Tax=Lunatimonas lonarensis TaxID=1232681 RepID=R7ZLC0_9BACT|nr:hypothetical protein ADIS_4735 [Lunatimonas lonarensis]